MNSNIVQEFEKKFMNLENVNEICKNFVNLKNCSVKQKKEKQKKINFFKQIAN